METVNNNYKATLRERLKTREEWIINYLIYRKHTDITKKVTKETQGEVPLISILLKIYFLPIAILEFLSDLRGWHYYNKCAKEIQIIKDELNKNEGHYYYGKFITGPKKKN